MRHEYTLFKRFKDTKIRKGVVWYFYYYDVNGKRQSKSTGLSKKYEADQFAQEFMNEDDRTDITLQEYTTDFFVWDVCSWIKRQHAKGKPFSMSIAKQRRSHLTTYILPKFGHRILSSLNRIEIENWLIDLKRTEIKKDIDKKVVTKMPLSNQTKNHILYTFRIILREAEREALVPYNCLATVESLGATSRPRDIFTKEEIDKLFPNDITQLETIWGRKEYAYMFYILATTGMRVGEMRALCWKHIIWHENRNAIRIEQTVKHDNSIGTTKTHKSRIVVLTQRAQDYLDDWLHVTPFDQMKDLIFFGQDRRSTVTGRTLLNRFAKALKDVGIDTTGRNLVIHSFRHTYNTRLKPLLPTEVLQTMTGHSTDAMTELYNHPTFEDEYNQIIKFQNAIDSLD